MADSVHEGRFHVNEEAFISKVSCTCSFLSHCHAVGSALSALKTCCDCCTNVGSCSGVVSAFQAPSAYASPVAVQEGGNILPRPLSRLAALRVCLGFAEGRMNQR